MYSPNPFASGSSVSHWDVSAFPNQLMEPNINSDLTHNVLVPTDLTFAQLSDVGWVASACRAQYRKPLVIIKRWPVTCHLRRLPLPWGQYPAAFR